MTLKSPYKYLLSALPVFLLIGCGGGGSTNTPAPPKNLAPKITAFVASNVFEQDTFTITATANDTDGTIASYKWVQDSGTSVNDLITDGATLTFTAPDISIDEALSFTLTVKDNDSASVNATLNINVTANTAPTIAAISINPVKEREAISIVAQATDLEGEVVSYSWEQTSGTTVTNLIANTDTLSFTAPNISSDETLSFSLTVTDNMNDSASIDFTIDEKAFDEIDLANISDTGLASCFSNNVNLDMGSTAINCNGYKIQSLADLAIFTDLTDLTITNAELENIDDLADLTQLTALNLSNNSITDSTKIGSLTSLTTLNLSRNFLYTFSESYTKLTELNFLVLNDLQKEYGGTNINGESLAALTKLTHLEINDSFLYNASDIADLINLEELSMSHLRSNFNSLSFLTSFTQLKSLNISSNNSIGDLTALSQLTALEELNITYTGASDYSPLSTLVNLKKLFMVNSLYNNELDVADLTNLTALTDLDISGFKTIKNLDSLSIFTQLKALYIAQIDTAAINFLTDLTQLNILDVSGNRRLGDITPLENLVNLTELDLSLSTNLDNIMSLSKLTLLTKLNISSLYNKTIDLTPISFMPNLKELRINENSLSNLDSLSNLEHLERLELDAANLTELFDFTKLVNLSILKARQNQLANVDELLNAKQLTILALDSNYQLENIDGLANLTKLEYLNLNQSRKITTLSSLENLTSLTELYVSYLYSLTDVSSLFSLPKLRLMQFYGDSLVLCDDFDQLEQLYPDAQISRSYNCMEQPLDESLFTDQNLLSCVKSRSTDIADIRDIYCGYNQIESLAGIEQLTAMTSLRINNNNISDMSPLDALTSLTNLNITDNNISDLSPLAELTSLRSLVLSQNKINDISPLANLNQLTSIALNNNEISNLPDFTKLTKLQTLELTNNQINDLSAMSALTALRTVYLANNQINDISAMSTLTALRTVYLANNKISDLSSLSSLSNIYELYLQNNLLKDIEPLKTLSTLRYLDLRENTEIVCADITDLESTLDLYSVYKPSQCN